MPTKTWDLGLPAGVVFQVGEMPALRIGHGAKHANAPPQGGRDLHIALDAREEGGFWRFSVADNGPGFDPDKSGELFKPFSRLDERQAGGTGLGLTVVKRAVERHGGTVGAWSSPGEGAAFWWTLPVRAAAQG